MKLESMQTLARCSYLPKGPILSTAFPAGQQSDGVTLRIGIDQLRADLAKPDPVVGMRTLSLGQIAVKPRPTDGGGRYVCGHPEVQLSVARGIRPERQPSTVRVRAIMGDRRRNPVLRGLAKIVSHGRPANTEFEDNKGDAVRSLGKRQPRSSIYALFAGAATLEQRDSKRLPNGFANAPKIPLLSMTANNVVCQHNPLFYIYAAPLRLAIDPMATVIAVRQHDQSSCVLGASP